MQQHALGRIDAQPFEQFGVAQRQFHHLAQLVDGVGHAADIVISHIGAARFARLLIFGAQFDFGFGVDHHDTLWHGRYDHQPDFLQRIGGRGQHLAQLGRHVAGRHLLLRGGCDDITRCHRPLKEYALQRFGIPLKPQIILCRREHDSLGWARFDLFDLDEVARTRPGIGPLQPVQAQHVQPFVFLIGSHHARGCRPLAHDRDDIPFCQQQLRHNVERQPRQTASGILRPRIGDLNPAPAAFLIGHILSPQIVAP